ncbi:Gaf domaincontaining protein, partial [Globisporangium splendens]
MDTPKHARVHFLILDTSSQPEHYYSLFRAETLTSRSQNPPSKWPVLEWNPNDTSTARETQVSRAPAMGSPAMLAPMRSSAISMVSRTRPSVAIENVALGAIGLASMEHLVSVTANVFVKRTWKQRKSALKNEVVLEHKSTFEYQILSKATVPCTLDEISNVLSSTNVDHFNAGMLELLGSDFGYAIAVRSDIPSTSTRSSTFSLKELSLANNGSVLERGVKLIDYTERDNDQRRERRVAQLVKRQRGRGDDALEFVAGDLLCGYTLHQDEATRYTAILFYGSYATKTRGDRVHRKAATKCLRKLAQVSTKWVEIVLRRRLGEQMLLNPLDVFVPALSCESCDKDFHRIFRRSHFCCFCGCQTCGSCSHVQDVESRIGGRIVPRRICGACVKRVNEQALEVRQEGEALTESLASTPREHEQMRTPRLHRIGVVAFAQLTAAERVRHSALLSKFRHEYSARQAGASSPSAVKPCGVRCNSCFFVPMPQLTPCGRDGKEQGSKDSLQTPQRPVRLSQPQSHASIDGKREAPAGAIVGLLCFFSGPLTVGRRASDVAAYHCTTKEQKVGTAVYPRPLAITRSLDGTTADPKTQRFVISQSAPSSSQARRHTTMTQLLGWNFTLTARKTAERKEQQTENGADLDSPSSSTLSPASSSGSATTASPLPAKGNSSPELSYSSHDQVSEDEVFLSIAQKAIKQVKSISTNAFVNGTWKQRRSPANELLLEHKSQDEYRIISQSTVPCTLDEISSVLSSTNSEQFNSSMIEFLGSDFSNGATLRTVATDTPKTTSLSVKVLVFRNSTHHHQSITSQSRGLKFLDYTERDNSARTEHRVLQMIKRRSCSPDGVKQHLVGDVVCGYALRECPKTRHTMVSLYSSYLIKSSVDRTTRHAVIHRLRKIAQVSTKWMDIAMRRRLGKQEILDPLNASRSIVELSCVSCNEDFHSIFRKRYFCNFCGWHACGSCSSVEDVEVHTGKIEKHRVCHGCYSEINGNALAKREASVSPGKPKYQLYHSHSA